MTIFQFELLPPPTFAYKGQYPILKSRLPQLAILGGMRHRATWLHVCSLGGILSPRSCSPKYYVDDEEDCHKLTGIVTVAAVKTYGDAMATATASEYATMRAFRRLESGSTAKAFACGEAQQCFG
jgi:hypothetical protein